MRTNKSSQSYSVSPFSSRTNIAKKLYQQIYKQTAIILGLPKKYQLIFSHLSRKNTMAIVGVALGDEGKGRLVDNSITQFLKDQKIKTVDVVRFQGGNNAGHTVEKGKIKLALHLVPSGVLHKKAINIIDRGVVVHLEDLRTEVEYVEASIGNLSKRLLLSRDAVLCTDLERAEEILNRQREQGASGGTGRGIGPSYAHHYDKTGLTILDMLTDTWEQKLGDYYDQYKKIFAGFSMNLDEIEVPDYKETLRNKKASSRTVGSKTTFLNRLRSARTWLLKKKIVSNTFLYHQKIATDPTHAVLFEGAQASGLDAWLGTLPDVTASNTSVYGIREGTGFWRIQDIERRVGVFKIPYTSSVGSRRMPTHIDIPSNLPSHQSTSVIPAKAGIQKKIPDPSNSAGKQVGDDNLSQDQAWALWIRKAAHEYGTTTGRPRDITFLDLPFLSYNIRMSGIELLMGTHLDTAQETDTIKICTHYLDKNGKHIPYQPGLHYLKDVHPQYIELPGWDGIRCQKAKTKRDLPKNALRYLSFIQQLLQTPIIAVTTGPDRKHIVYF